MKRAIRFLTIAAVFATFLTFTAARPATAVAVGCSTTIPPGGGDYTFITGHSYTLTFGSLFVDSFVAGVDGPDGTLPLPGGFTIIDNSVGCGGTFFSPGDSRVEPQPGDRIAVYCNTGVTPPTVGVYGIDSKANGVFLAAVNVSDIIKAGEGGFVKQLGKKGTLFVGVGADGTSFWAAWQGPFGANASGSFAKTFTCNFASK